jgi:hypothetical protein
MNLAEIACIGTVSREIGWHACSAAVLPAAEDTARYAAATVWKLPWHAEVEKHRVIDHRPCPAMCRRCSRCIHSLDYWARGGRPYLGVQREAEAAAGAR